MSSRTSRAVKRHNSAKNKHHDEHIPTPNTMATEGEIIATPSKLATMATKYKLQLMIATPILLVLMVLATTTYLNTSNKNSTPVAYGQFFAALDNYNPNAGNFTLNKAYENAKNSVDAKTGDYLTYIVGVVKSENKNTTQEGLELLQTIVNEPYKSAAQGYIADATGQLYDGYSGDANSVNKNSLEALMPALWSYRLIVSNITNIEPKDQMGFVAEHPESNLAALLNVIAAGEME